MTTYAKQAGTFFATLAVLYLMAPLGAMGASLGQRADDPLLAAYAGTYVLPSGARLAVSVEDGRLAVRPLAEAAVGTVFVAPLPETEALQRLDRQAEAMLGGIARGRTDAIERVLPASRRTQGTADLMQLFNTFTAAHGALVRYEVLGSVPHGADRAWTLARLTFAHGAETVRLTWQGGFLKTIQRGPLPTRGARPAFVTHFRSADAGTQRIRFNLRADGSVESLTVEGRHGAVTAYKLAPAPAPVTMAQ